MTNESSSATFTTEFGHEIEAERARWLRRRFLWYAGAVLVLNGFSTLLTLTTLIFPSVFDSSASNKVGEPGVALASSVFAIVLYATAFMYVRRHQRPKIPPLKIVFWLIICSGVVQLLSGPIVARQIVGENGIRVSKGGLVIDTRDKQRPTTPAPPNAAAPESPAPAPSEEENSTRELSRSEHALATLIGAGLGVFSLLGLHFFACLFLPWTPGESIKPLVPLLTLNAVLILVFMVVATAGGYGSTRLVLAGFGFILCSGFVALPGAAVCWWRNSRFRDRWSTRMLRGRYMELRQELTNARTIHESLFPRPHLSGPVRFNYVYEPMRQIGGDYLFATFQPGPSGQRALNIALIDVTGHGIPAALTVNRLHGELERVFAENPSISPGEVLRLLNSYVHLTLATHSVYVTAVCFRIDPGQPVLEYASGGHPPAFVRSIDGRIEQLDSTTFVLGACAGGDFQSSERKLPFFPGDSLIAYTDGALEARDANGRFLGVAGLLKILASSKPEGSEGWPRMILRSVERHRYGPTADDTLVIEVTRALDTAPATDVARKTGVFTLNR